MKMRTVSGIFRVFIFIETPGIYLYIKKMQKTEEKRRGGGGK